MRTAYTCTLLALAALAGCLDAVETDTTIEARDVPSRAAAGEPFTFPLEVRQASGESDHIGAHFWSQSTSDPDGDFDQQAGACEHTGGALPGTFNVTCTLDGGPVFLRGHLRTDQGDFWTQEFEIEVVDIQLRADNASSTASVGERITFDLHIEGGEASSDHVGAHFWDQATDDPTGDFGAQAGACEHQSGQVDAPTTVEVQCVFDAPGTFHVFGHMRLGTLDLWAEPFVVQVA